MEWYQAREVQKDGQGTGKWHYTCSSGSGTYAVGYCSPWELCVECNGDTCDKCKGRGIVRKENPCPGHDTPDEANEHYAQYVIDKATFEGESSRWDSCAVCGDPTKHAGISQAHYHYPLCETHLNREGFEQAYRKRE